MRIDYTEHLGEARRALYLAERAGSFHQWVELLRAAEEAEHACARVGAWAREELGGEPAIPFGTLAAREEIAENFERTAQAAVAAIASNVTGAGMRLYRWPWLVGAFVAGAAAAVLALGLVPA